MESYSISKSIHSGPALLRTFFFVAGITATVAYRITPFIPPLWVKIAWYVGTIGFMLYFWHRAHIESKRAKLVQEYDLVNAVETSSLHGDQKTAVAYLVKTSLTSKARFNSVFIAVASALALAAAILLDLQII
ncbi:MAG TPA: hypothetical protein VI937_01465 [Negativicutes bacterium]|nr:hypothetical protein [Negativicutes bacterium]